MKQFLQLKGEEINALGNDGYRLITANLAKDADELAPGKNTIVLTFMADNKPKRDYTAGVPADCIGTLAECINKEPTEVFVKLWKLNHSQNGN